MVAEIPHVKSIKCNDLNERSQSTACGLLLIRSILEDRVRQSSLKCVDRLKGQLAPPSLFCPYSSNIEISYATCLCRLPKRNVLT